MPCLRTSPERKSTSKSLKRVLRVRAEASMAGFRTCRKCITNCLGSECVPDETRVFCNFPEFREVHDQDQNTYRPCPHHCAASDFAPVSAELGRVRDRRNDRGEELMSRTLISAMALFGATQMIRKLTGLNVAFFPSLCRRGADATTRSLVLVLIVVLLAASPLPVSAATPDPVLEWIDVMNTTVLTA